jgi:hypothetical protein
MTSSPSSRSVCLVEAEAVLKKHGISGQGGTIEFERAQALRTKLREKLDRTRKGSVKQELTHKSASWTAGLRKQCQS